MGVEVLLEVFKMVVKKAMMYGMEVYWNGQRDMRNKLQVWLNRGLRGILGAVGTTPIAALLGEVGMKGVEVELDEIVAKWGRRLIRRGFGDGFGNEWREEMERVGVWKMGWQGRIIRGL